MRAECNPRRRRQRIGLPIVGALTFCPLVLISYHYFLFLSTYYYILRLEAQMASSGRIGHDRLFPRGVAARRRAIGTGPPRGGAAGLLAGF